MKTQDIVALIQALADKHQVFYKETATDILAGHFTRLSDESVQLDPTQLLLLALRRAGHITSEQAMELLGAYLHSEH